MNNKKSLLTTLIILLLLVVVYVFMFTPLRGERSELKSEVSDLQAELSRKQEQIEPKQEQDGDFGEIGKRVLELAIPNRFDQDDLIEQLSKIASDNLMEFQGVSFTRDRTESQFIDSVKMSMNVSGGIFNFLEFLHELESKERFYNVQNFTLTIGEEEPRQVNFSVNLEVYHS